jgi:hypothetical protein
VIEDAVRQAHALGALVVFSAGNSNDDVAYRSPQNMTDARPVVVAASDPDDQPTSFTNWGALVDVAAPGGGTESEPGDQPLRNILSLKSNVCNPGLCPPELVVGSAYLRQAGTSMAAPHVSGLAASYSSAPIPVSPSTRLKQRIFGNALDLGPDGSGQHVRLRPDPGPGLAAGSRALRPRPRHEARLRDARRRARRGDRHGHRSELLALRRRRGRGDEPDPVDRERRAPDRQRQVGRPLATWDTTGFPNGTWTIRLRVFDTAESVRVAYVRVTLDNALQPGWPQLTAGGPGSYHATLVAADLDGDGQNEVIAGSYYGLLYAWRHDGSLVAGFPVEAASYGGETLTPQWAISTTIRAGDRRRLGRLASTAAIRTSSSSTTTGPSSRAGRSCPANYISDPPTLADLDGDGELKSSWAGGWRGPRLSARRAGLAQLAGEVDHGQNVSGRPSPTWTVTEIWRSSPRTATTSTPGTTRTSTAMAVDRVAGWPVSVPSPRLATTRRSSWLRPWRHRR